MWMSQPSNESDIIHLKKAETRETLWYKVKGFYLCVLRYSRQYHVLRRSLATILPRGMPRTFQRPACYS